MTNPMVKTLYSINKQFISLIIIILAAKSIANKSIALKM